MIARVLRGLLAATAILTAAVALLPFLGPYVGLADYQELAAPPGRAVPLPGGTLNVYQAGSGPDLLLTHGHPGSAQMMAPLARALAETGFRVTWYDRMGWGHSGQRPTDEPANPTAHARDLLDLTAALDLTAPVYVGYSYGGGVVMEANRLAPDRVQTMVLVSSIGPGPRRGQTTGLQRLMSSPLFLRWAFSLDAVTRAASAAITASLVAPEQLPQQEVDALLASFALPGVPTAWRRESDERYVGFDDYQPALVRGCVQLIHGQADRVVELEMARANTRQIPGASLIEIPEAGHAMVMTQPRYLTGLIRAHTERCA